MTTDELSFSYPGGNSSRRAFRVQTAQLEVTIFDSEHNCKVKDLSGVGVAFFAWPGLGLSAGEVIQIGLRWRGRSYLEHLPGRVVRVADDLVGCEFVGLHKGQEYALDKLVLEVQKEQIELDKNDSDT